MWTGHDIWLCFVNVVVKLLNSFAMEKWVDVPTSKLTSYLTHSKMQAKMFRTISPHAKHISKMIWPYEQLSRSLFTHAEGSRPPAKTAPATNHPGLHDSLESVAKGHTKTKWGDEGAQWGIVSASLPLLEPSPFPTTQYFPDTEIPTCM